MKYWKLNIPEKIYTGENSIDNLFNIVNNNSTFIAIDPNLEKTDFGLKIKTKLSNKNITYFNNISSDPKEDEVLLGAYLYNQNKCKDIIAIGGGSTIDISKAIGLIANNNYDIKQIYNKESSKEIFPKFTCVPTTCGTGAEVSPYALISDKNTYKKTVSQRSFFIPKNVILDITSLKYLSSELVAGSCLDTLVHAMEVHMSNYSDSLVKIQTCGSLYKLGKSISINNKKITYNYENLLNIACTSRMLFPETGLSIAHGIAHPLGGITGLHHGMTVGILLEETLKINYKYASESILESCNLLGFKDISTFLDFLDNFIEISGIKEYVKKYFKNIDINTDYIANLALRSSNIRSNPKTNITETDIKNMLSNTFKKYL